jgi:hypothetical protein
LGPRVDAWLDKTGAIEGLGLNDPATRLANAYGINARLWGVVVILGVDQDTGETVGLTDDQVHEIAGNVDVALPPAVPTGSSSSDARLDAGPGLR